MKSKFLCSILLFLVSSGSVLLFLSCNGSKSENQVSPNVLSSKNTSGAIPKSETPISEIHEFNWFCTNILGKSVSEVRNKFGQQDDCIGCTSESGELRYRNIMTDAMGTNQTLGLTYYKGVITRCEIVGSYPKVECIKSYEGE